ALVIVVGPAPAGAEPAPRWSIDLAATAWQPRRDAADYAATSAGLRPRVGFALHPAIAITADFDWVFVEREPSLVAGDIYYYAASVGARLTPPRPWRVRPFADLTAGRYALHVECAPRTCGGALVHDAALGYRLGGGATAVLAPWLTAEA